MIILKKSSVIALLISVNISFAESEKVEVMHFWTSGGESKALSYIKDELEKQNYVWKDSPIAGGGGENAKTVLRSRIASGNPPSAMLILGQEVIDWGNEGLLSSIQNNDNTKEWDLVLSDEVKKFTKIDDKYVSIPTNIHRINMVWASKAAFRKIGADIPNSWEEFNELAIKFKKEGIIPLAHGGQTWQEMTLFDSVALGIGGTKYYNELLVNLSPKAAKNSKLIKIFDQMRFLSNSIDKNSPGRDWNVATSMVINGTAAMQIMGDWAKGEFSSTSKVSGKDYLCFPAPGTNENFIYLINSLSLFEQQNTKSKLGQTALANAIMDPKVQENFNLAKGSIPARNDIDMTQFDECSKASMIAFKRSNAIGGSVPSFAFSHAAPSVTVGAFSDVITHHFNNKDITSKEAADSLYTVLTNN